MDNQRKSRQALRSPLTGDEKGRIGGTFNSAEDTTEHKQTAESLKVSEEQFRGLFQNMTEGCLLGEIILDSNGKIYDVRYLDVNRAWEKSLKITRDEAIGKTYRELVPQALTEIINLYGNAALTGKPGNFEIYSPSTKEWISVYAFCLAPGKFAAVVTDITEQKRAEKSLRESQERLQILIDRAPIPIGIARHGLTVYVNSSYLRLFGYEKAEEIYGHSLLEQVAPQCRDEVDERARKRDQGLPVPVVYESIGLRRDGSQFPYLASIALIDLPDGPASLAFFTDITERKKTEEALARANDDLEAKVKERTRDLSQAKEQLEAYAREIIRAQETERKRVAVELHDDTAQNLALLALEVDNILNGPERLPEETVKRLKILQDDINRTQGEARRFSHELRPGVLDCLGLEAALEGLVKDISDKGDIAVDLKISGQERRLPDEVELSLFRIAQESLNNSQKHSQASKALVELKFYRKRVTLDISDNGKGFNVRKDSRDAARRRRLGLIGMRERAELIGGKLKIRSVIGRGSTVTIEVRQ